MNSKPRPADKMRKTVHKRPHRKESAMAKKQTAKRAQDDRPRLGRPRIDQSDRARTARQWAAEGLTNEQIAVRLDCSTRQVSRLLAIGKALPPGTATMETPPTSIGSGQPDQSLQDLILPRTGQAPIKIRGRTMATATGMYFNAKPGKPNVDWWEISIFALDRPDAYAVAITYKKSHRGQNSEHHTAAVTATPATVLQTYDPLKVLVGYPSSERFATQQRDLELDCVRQYQSLVSTVLADFPEEATVDTDATRLAAAIEFIRRQLKTMTDQQRLDLFDLIEEGYCPNCGGTEGRRCQCANDE